MADCPKCNKSIPCYKAFINTRWSGIKCKFCGTKSFVTRKDLYGWKSWINALIILLLFILNYYFVVYVRYFIIHDKTTFRIFSFIDLFFCLFVSYYFMKFWWRNIKLEIRDKFWNIVIWFLVVLYMLLLPPNISQLRNSSNTGSHFFNLFIFEARWRISFCFLFHCFLHFSY